MRIATLEQLPVIFVVSVILFIIFTLAMFPYAPLQDLPEWIYQDYIFNELISGHASGEFRLVTYPVPYTLFPIMTSAVLLLFSPLVTSKIVVVIYSLLVLLAIHRLISKANLDPLAGWVILVSVVALNSPFWNGYLSYQFGLIILLFYLSLSLEVRTEAFPVLLFSLLAFFTHGMIYASMLVFIGIYSIYSRRILQCAFMLMPSICLFMWYELKHQNSGDVQELFSVHGINLVVYKIYTLLKAAPFHQAIVFDFSAVDYFGTAYLILGMLIDFTFFVSLGMLAYAAVSRTSPRAFALKPEFIIAALLSFIALALPPTLFGIVNPGERVMYPALIAFAIAVCTEPKLPPAPKAALTAAFIGGYGLLAIALFPAAAIYRDKNESYQPQPATTPSRLSGRSLFGHRFMQFDDKMKYAEQAWRAGTMPDAALAFDTALILPKRK